MSKKLYEEENIRAIAESIRGKTGAETTYTTATMPSGVEEVYEAGIDEGAENLKTSEARTGEDLVVEGATVSVPSGYYAEAASAAVATVEQATPTITLLSRKGIVEVTSKQEEGYVTAGTKTPYLQLDCVRATTFIPSTEKQVAVAAGKYTLGDITIPGSVNLVPEHIKSGVSIYNVTGTFDNYDAGYDEGYAAGKIAAIEAFETSGLVDWDIASRSGHCTVSVVNNHPSMFLHISVYIKAVSNNETWTGTLVIDPLDSNSFRSGDTYNAESDWFTEITEMRFSEDGT